MKKFLVKFVEVLLIIIAIFIILLAIMLSLARAFTPYLNQHRLQLQQVISKNIQYPVQIAALKATWEGFEPSVLLQNVEVFKANQAILAIKQIHANLNLWESLWHWKPIISQVEVNGLTLNIQLKNQHLFSVNDVVVAEQKDQARVTSALGYLINHGQISGENIDLNINTNKQWYKIQNFSFILKHSLLQHKMALGGIWLTKPNVDFHIIADLRGNLLQFDTLTGVIYAKFNQLDVKNLAKFNYIEKFPIKTGIGDLRLWLYDQNGAIRSAQSLLNFKNLSFIYQNKLQVLQALKANLIWNKLENGFAMAGRQVAIETDQQAIAPFNFSFQLQNGAKIFQIDHLNLNSLAILQHDLLLTAEMNKAIDLYKPTGELENLRVDFLNNKNWSLKTHFAQLAWQVVGKLPSMTDLNGQVTANQDHGMAVIFSEKSQLSAPDVFFKPLAISGFFADFNWHKTADAWQVNLPQLFLAFNTMQVKAHGRLNFLTKQATRINLHASFSESNAHAVTDYLPMKIFHPKLRDWLNQAFGAGGAFHGDMLWRGPLQDFPYLNHQGTFVLKSQVKNIDFTPAPGWPPIKNVTGNLNFITNSMSVIADQGEMNGAKILQVKALIPDMSSSVLIVDGEVAGDLQSAQQYINESPLKDSVGEKLSRLMLQGPMQLQLHLLLPLEDQKIARQVQGTLSMKNADLNFMPAEINIHDVNGAVTFNNHQLASKILTGNVFGFPLEFSLNNKLISPDKYMTDIWLKGQISMDALKKHFGDLAIFHFLAGKTNYQGNLLAGEVAGIPSYQLKLNTDLAGMQVNLPTPYAKTATQKLPSMFSIDSQSRGMDIGLDYGNYFSARVDFKPASNNHLSMTGGEIVIGGGLAKPQSLPGFIIQGHMGTLNIPLWQAFWQQHDMKTPNSKTNTTDLKQKLRAINLNVANLIYKDQQFKNIDLSLMPGRDFWSLKINSQNLRGSVLIPDAFPDGTLQLDFTRCYFPAAKQHQQVNIQQLAKIQAINFYCQNLQSGADNVGAVSLETLRENRQILIKKFNVQAQNFQLKSSGSYDFTAAKPTTSLSGVVTTKNLGKFLSQYHYSQNLAGGNGYLAFVLQWPGAPWPLPAIKDVSGDLGVDFANGNIKNLSNKTNLEVGFGKILTLLSLQSLPRRLHLDFSDLADKGFSFNRLLGKFQIADGSVTTQLAEIDSSVARVEINGRIGLVNRDYNLLIRVSPHYMSSLPIIATIAGGPIAGAVAFLANRLVSPELSKITSYNYRVTGAWQQPKLMKLKEVKDN